MNQLLMMNLCKILLFSFLWVFPVILRAQNDTTLILEPEVLQEKNIVIRASNMEPEVAISATRMPEATQDLPFTVWTISSAEILRNGYVTLGDVLKAAPGIRVSQPGNALEGETFQMRGLSGNQYVKILINDLPVKPTILGGMPIGAQLPIRQAERIEVLYGPAAALYGNEACAGVVNIILKESDRPLYTQADLSIGNNRFNSLDLMFGGKLGRDKKIFRFSLYGSSTVRNWYQGDQYNDTGSPLLKPGTYLPAHFTPALYLNNPNYRHQLDNDELAFANSMAHESRMFGVNLRWRGVQFNYHRMLRFDHTALGLNPFAISWANPSNRIQEQLDAINIRLQRSKGRRTSLHALSLLGYKIDPNSSTTYLYNHLVRASYQIHKNSGSTVADDVLLRQRFDIFASNERYNVAGGFDARLESKTTYHIRSKLRVTGGFMSNLGRGNPFSSYLTQPNQYRFFADNRFTGPIFPESDGFLDVNLFAQIEWRTPKLYFNASGLAGGAIGNELIGFTAPRLALSYKIDSSWSVWGNYSTGIRYPNLQHLTNTYQINISSGGLFRGSDSRADIERTHQIEGGVRFLRNDLTVNISAFSQQADNLIRNDVSIKETNTGNPSTDNWIYGYQNVARQNIWGIQGRFTSVDQSIELNNGNARKRDINITGRTEYFIQYTRGWEYPGVGIQPVQEIFNQPRWHRQFRFFIRASKLEMMISTNTQSSVLSKSLLYRDREALVSTLSRYPKFRTNDLSLRWYFSKYFVGYMHAQNIFNRQYSGLDATGTADDLLFNLQQGRIVRIGVSYSVN